jgi:S-methylmethionine-dependent homocysteine/selenocysteine methylase|tara:strand:- start:327 stop:428 length:102 start_codon:yes stop_codon:yes gene_type:complete
MAEQTFGLAPILGGCCEMRPSDIKDTAKLTKYN